MGIIAWALNTWGTNFHQIIMDTISTPLASLGSVVGWAYVIFVPLLCEPPRESWRLNFLRKR
ncbi:N,N'-diacetylchitobiose-specific enzyme IIC component of PTS domain protein [Shigella flexneri CCH060]|uniref:N,N'-diacetylchitobiose-specific enzyme IIC component of PTS domain protein n=1 Tax=Shigella flexneri CCH060 TaxID=754091 RepID=A0A6N3R595_SHIFL|nr:N,N'-diacetylchitobiose-specific enzyme IIC component of PTS domain protein [Shigella flexneri CCH060]SPZ75763.1 N,N'-diacetylchitobiose permease IIC component [Shigella boydii]